MNDHSLLIKLMERLARFRKVKIGRGPEHPTDPIECKRRSIIDFISKYPILMSCYSDYCNYLLTYSGASINYDIDTQDDYFLHLDLYGFDDSITNVYQDDWFNIEGQGFLIFADFDYRYRKWKPDTGLPYDGIKHTFGLINLLPERKNGIYLFTYAEHFNPNEEEDFSKAIFFSDTFLEWLDRYISLGGRIPESKHDEFKEMSQQPVL